MQGPGAGVHGQSCYARLRGAHGGGGGTHPPRSSQSDRRTDTGKDWTAQPGTPGWKSASLRLLGWGLASPLRPALSPMFCLPAKVANLGRAIHLQLCSVRIPQAKEDILHAVTLLARSHTPELVATFLDFSIPLDRCPAPPSPRPPWPTLRLPQAGGGLPPLPSWPAPSWPTGSPAGLGAGKEPTPRSRTVGLPRQALGRSCSLFFSQPSLIPITSP